MSVELDVQYVVDRKGIPDPEQLNLWAAKAIQGKDPVHIGIRIVDEVESQSLNHEYRGKDKPTNVLSFPMELPEELGETILGDLVICAPVVEKEAAEQYKSSEAHWAHMVIHGVLHLQGFDHISDEQAEEMETLEIKYLEELGYKNPYISIHE
ncbi:MAG: rRNA maturation RNase YbeY [Gammaproteobacteria bacterium]|nr:rRNA maturation RNase YbeY [Gammaproteobacteria bacterium]MDH5734869.1 rRNA maturation RNase YbeY [Gammaproteobacteria bacterium]